MATVRRQTRSVVIFDEASGVVTPVKHPAALSSSVAVARQAATEAFGRKQCELDLRQELLDLQDPQKQIERELEEIERMKAALERKKQARRERMENAMRSRTQPPAVQ